MPCTQLDSYRYNTTGLVTEFGSSEIHITICDVNLTSGRTKFRHETQFLMTLDSATQSQFRILTHDSAAQRTYLMTSRPQ